MLRSSNPIGTQANICWYMPEGRSHISVPGAEMDMVLLIDPPTPIRLETGQDPQKDGQPSFGQVHDTQALGNIEEYVPKQLLHS